jgi:peptidoglycan hydrolase-like protein with peptidoglycan-binding domain
MSAPIGPDYASVDRDSKPNFPAAKQAGARFVIPRAIYGRPVVSGTKAPFKDPVWARDKDAIVAAGLKRTAYLFICYPQANVYTPPPEDQAQAYIDYVQLDQFKDYIPMIDVEQTSTLSSSEMYDWTLRIARLLREHYGAWPGMYTSARVWAENLDHHSPGPLLNCPLWLAKPWPWLTNTPVHLDGAPAYMPTLIPEFSNQWFIYQYQGDATQWPGFDRTVDANRFRVFGKGAKGAHVVWLQKRLGITADGIFGDQTEAAVKALQTKYGLAADGIVGPSTFAPLCWSNPAA